MAVETGTTSGFQAITAGLRPLFLLIGLAGAVAAGVGVVLWAKGPTWNLLYANLPAEDAGRITQALQSAGIPYRLQDGAGSIAVPEERINEARLKLAGQGLPESSGGFAAMSKDPGFGVSQFMEGARYQHALETELSQTIASLQQVQGARVHIAAPRSSSFIQDRRQASASVFVQLHSGRRLTAEQVSAIVNLVASSVPELDATQVTVVDQSGRLLSHPESNSELAISDRQLEMSHQLEESYSQRIESLLAPLVGQGRVRAQVVAQIDMAASEEAREVYRPDSQIVRSEQSSEENRRDGAAGGASGIPGSLTNQPPEKGVAQPPGATAARPAAGTAGAGAGADAGSALTADNNSRQSNRNYEIDRTVAYSHQPAGRLKRLSVAVLIDNLRITAKDGKVTESALPAAQIERITGLVKDAVGFDAARGDSVSVVNAAWSGEPILEPEKIEGTPLWQQPLLRDVAKIVAGLILALIVIFMVLRPTLRSLLAGPALAKGAAKGTARIANAAAGSVAAGAMAAGATIASGGADVGPAGNALAYEQQIAAARTLASQDSGRVAQVVKNWVADDQ